MMTSSTTSLMTSSITLVNSETRVSYMNFDSYLKLSPDSESYIGFAMLVTVFKQMGLLHFAVFSIYSGG